jgi:predicted porin
MAAKIGWDGIMFDVVNTGTGGGVTDSFVSIPDDATKIIYFTPRVAGFQLGASLTPDTGVNGRGVFIDNDGTPENVWDLGANWEGSFGDVSMIVSATYETGSQPNLGGPGTAATEDHEVFSVGGTASFKGFSIAGGYADLGEGGITTAASAAGADAGEWWNAAVGYTMGPWTFSLAYMETEKANTTGIADTTWDIFSAGMTYNVAPGWDLLGEIDWFDGKNINATAVPVDNQGTVVILTNYFYF